MSCEACLSEIREVQSLLAKLVEQRSVSDWAGLPLVCDLKTTARVLGRSVRVIEEDLADGVMTPAPMPRRRSSRGAKWQWSRVALQRYLDGGYALQKGRRR